VLTEVAARGRRPAAPTRRLLFGLLRFGGGRGRCRRRRGRWGGIVGQELEEFEGLAIALNGGTSGGTAVGHGGALDLLIGDLDGGLGLEAVEVHYIPVLS